MLHTCLAALPLGATLRPLIAQKPFRSFDLELKEEELEKVSAAIVSLTYGAIQWTYTKQDDKADARS